MQTEKLLLIKEKIEKMTKNYQIDILQILKTYSEVYLNENTNGIFINLSELNEEILEKIIKFIEYVDTQEKQLNSIEAEKNMIENNFFKLNKDINIKDIND